MTFPYKAIWRSKKGYSRARGEIVEVVRRDAKSGKFLIIAHPTTENERRAAPGGFSYFVDADELTVAFRNNPTRPPAREIQQAARRFKAFTGRAPDRVEKIPIEPMPKVGLAFGELVEIGYISYRDGLPYRHSFRPLRSRPLVVSTPDGKRLLLIGGSYSFTERGIVNK